MLFFHFFRPQFPLSSLENRALLSTSARKRRVRGSRRRLRVRLPRSRSRKTRSRTGSFGTRRHLSRQSSTGSQLTTTPCTSVRTEYDSLFYMFFTKNCIQTPASAKEQDLAVSFSTVYPHTASPHAPSSPRWAAMTPTHSSSSAYASRAPSVQATLWKRLFGRLARAQTAPLNSRLLRRILALVSCA